MDAKLATLHQLAERTGLPAAWLKREADAGRLPCLRVGRRLMFDIETVRLALTERVKQEGAARA